MFCPWNLLYIYIWILKMLIVALWKPINRGNPWDAGMRRLKAVYIICYASCVAYKVALHIRQKGCSPCIKESSNSKAIFISRCSFSKLQTFSLSNQPISLLSLSPLFSLRILEKIFEAMAGVESDERQLEFLFDSHDCMFKQQIRSYPLQKAFF